MQAHRLRTPVHLTPERKIPGSCGEGFEGDVVAEGLELGNGSTRFSSLVAAHGHGGLIRMPPSCRDLKENDQQSRWSEAVWWAWEDLNLRPYPKRRIARVSTGSAAPRKAELGRATDSHPSWRPPAMAVLSEIDGRAQCYHEFLQAVPIRQCHKDGVNRGLAPGSRNTTISVFLPE